MLRRAISVAFFVVAAACGASTAPGVPRASEACDVETRRKVTCDHLYPELADKARDVCVRSWSCASRFLRPESISLMVDCEAHEACSVDCMDADERLAPLPEEIAFDKACRERAESCHLDCAALTHGHRGNVARFWNDMTACFARPTCGEPESCLANASRRPLQAVGCMF